MDQNDYKVLEEIYDFQLYNVEGFWSKGGFIVFCSIRTKCSSHLKLTSSEATMNEIYNELAKDGGII